MDVRIDQASAAERRIASELRARAMQLIEERSMSREELAEQLGLLPVGARMLLERSEWPVDVAIRVAEALGISVELEASS